MDGTVLIVAGNGQLAEDLARVFDEGEITPLSAADSTAAIELLSSHKVDVLLADAPDGGLEWNTVLSEIGGLFPDLPVLVLTNDPDRDIQAAADKPGLAPNLIARPWQADDLRLKVRDALIGRRYPPEQAALLRFGGLTPRQIERADRVRKKLDRQISLGEVLVEMGQLTDIELARIERSRRAEMTIPAILREEGALTPDGDAVLERLRETAPGLSERDRLVGQGLVTEEQYMRALADKHHLPFVIPELEDVNPDIAAQASIRYLIRESALPLDVEDHRLRIALADPLNPALVIELERIFNRPIQRCVATSDRIRDVLKAVNRLRDVEGKGESLNIQYREIQAAEDDPDGGEEAVRIVDSLLLRAIQLGASDLHIEPLQKKLRVRVRVDGVLHQLSELPVEIANRLASRVKILAGADIAEKRQHQDGKIFVKVEGSEVDIRVSSYVSIFGENLVLRLLDRTRNLMPVEAIGFNPRIMATIEDIVLRTSSGLVLITGPTGSGKTTTLYSLVEHSLDPSEKAISCEDPVEYVIDGIIQCSVNQKTGPTFADSLRSMLRQDPDTILVGEIRDGVTASLAFEAALTGHKVFSTFHTEDSVSVVIRLLEMGVEPFLVASTMNTVIGQRLMRKLCPNCIHQAEPSRADLRFLGKERAEFRGIKLFEGKGCELCGGSGYKGRLGIHEVFIPDDGLKDAILGRAPAKHLRELARNLPDFLTLQEDALLKVIEGKTSLAEVVGSAPRDTNCRPLDELRSISGLGRK